MKQLNKGVEEMKKENGFVDEITRMWDHNQKKWEESKWKVCQTHGHGGSILPEFLENYHWQRLFTTSNRVG